MWVLFDMDLGTEAVDDVCAQMIGVKSCVGNNMPDAVQTYDQTSCLWAVTSMARSDEDPGRQVKRIDGGVHLGGPSALGAANTGSFKPVFGAVASACVLHMVAPTRVYSKSGSRLDALQGLSQTAAIVQRRNRKCALRQLPGSGGRSRQDDAPRAGHKIASNNNRLSAPARPRPPSLPETKGAIIAHFLSVKERPLKIASRF